MSLNVAVLVVEDDEPKLRSVLELLGEELKPGMDVVQAASLSSAVRVLSTREVRLAIVDMSLPTFDFATDRLGGGQPQGYGGADILRFIESETAHTKSIVLTQYEEFPARDGSGQRTIPSLEAELRTELGERFLGIIHYSGSQGEWRERLLKHLADIGLVRAR